MTISTIKMSSKGQIAIPQLIREQMGLYEGTLFVAVASKDSIMLKKIDVPSKEKIMKDFKDMVSENTKRNEKLGIKESDVPRIIEEYRKSKRNENNSRH